MTFRIRRVLGTNGITFALSGELDRQQLALLGAEIEREKPRSIALLTAEQRGGGQQTRSLRFRAADGRTFAFRSLDKDPSAILAPDLRGTVVQDLVQDQISAAHPAGP